MINTCLGNVVVGLCQLVTVMFLLIGWFWSIIWGCALVGHSSKFVTMLLPSVLDRADKNNREFGKYNGNVSKDVGSSTIAFLLEDKGDYKLYSLEHSSTP